MAHRLQRLTVSFVLASSFLSCGEADAPVAPDARIQFEPGHLVSAETCGNCHKDIYSFWRGSVHAQAPENEAFVLALQEAEEIAGAESRKLCLTCHSPATVVNGDLALSQPVSREGIGCDFCHSLTGTDLSNPDHPFLLKISSVKYGPVKDAVSTGHEVAYSEFHTSSLHCAGCHEYTNRHGVELLSTYSEWETYQRSQGGKSCQECHMPLVLANVVDPKIKRVEHSFVNLHSMPGGHSLDQLTKSVRLRIMEMSRQDDQLKVAVQLKNVGAGHMVPTGTPSRKILLLVAVSPEDGEAIQDERTYQRIILDQDGEPILRDARLFLDGFKVGSDSRLAPGEERMEEFLLQAVPEGNLSVTATLIYLYSPHNRPETETRIEFFSETKKLVSTWRR